MTRRDALRLKPGTPICYGDNAQVSKCLFTMEGIVEYVTPKGGIKLEGGGWVPYHHVIDVGRAPQK